VTPSGRPRFALDQNFPSPIVRALEPYIAEAQLVPLGDLHPRLAVLEDWHLLVALSQQTPSIAGLVTTDSSMLRQEREISVLLQAKLTLVVAEAAGDDPLKATGLLLTHLPWIARQRHGHQAQVWVLRATNKRPDDPWELLRGIATRRGEGDPRSLYDQNKVGSLGQLARAILAPDSAPPGRGRAKRRKR
jgi:hypothetical protein